MTDNTQDELSKEKGQKIFHKKLLQEIQTQQEENIQNACININKLMSHC
jgi:hypothetical protein